MMKQVPINPLRKTSMNMTQLEEILQMLGVPPYYDLSGTARDCHCCFEHKNDVWTIYDSERGMRFHEVVCDNETDACLEILKRMMHLPMT